MSICFGRAPTQKVTGHSKLHGLVSLAEENARFMCLECKICLLVDPDGADGHGNARGHA